MISLLNIRIKEGVRSSFINHDSSGTASQIIPLGRYQHANAFGSKDMPVQLHTMKKLRVLQAQINYLQVIYQLGCKMPHITLLP